MVARHTTRKIEIIYQKFEWICQTYTLTISSHHIKKYFFMKRFKNIFFDESVKIISVKSFAVTEEGEGRTEEEERNKKI